MAADRNGDPRAGYRKANDLMVIVKFERDDSPEGKLRIAQAKAIICQLILLSRKRGRPSQKEENVDEAA